MLGRVLKPFLPRGLYWRAALIVFVPVVTIVLVMALAFIQRHYDGVTRQMTGNFALVARHVMDRIDTADDLQTAQVEAARMAGAFDLTLRLPATPPANGGGAPVPFYDLTSPLALEALGEELSNVTAIRIENGSVSLWLDGRYGLVAMDFPLSRISARNPHQLLVLMLVIGPVMGLISFLYLRNQMRPIARLAKAAEAFGHGQVVPFHLAGATEVRAASAAFLEMRERIERHIEQRTLMLSGVSHDLRTPLTRLRLGLSMIEDDPDARALMADVAEMEALIDRFLEFARFEAAEPFDSTDLRALVAERVAEAARDGADVTLEPGDAMPEVALRRQLFGRALDNLIGNALRHGTRARVRILPRDGGAVVEIEDDGPGIDPADYDRATRPFVRLDPARGASRGSGVGLGLAIVTDAMRGHGGRLELDAGDTPGLGGLVARLVVPVTQQAG